MENEEQNPIAQPTVDIGSWFDIKLYRATASFSRKDWYDNLYLRSQARAIIFPKRFADDPTSENERCIVSKFVWNAVRETPLLTGSASVKEAAFFSLGHADPAGSVTRLLSLPSIRPLTRHDLVRTRKRDCIKKVVDVWRRLPSRGVSHDQTVTRQQDLSFLHQALDIPGNIDDSRVRLIVDLDASNERLLADFKMWLDRARKAYRSPTDGRFRHTITDHVIEQWSRKRILAYLDIMLWVRLSGQKVKDVEWHRLLDPAGYAAAGRAKRPKAFDTETLDDNAKKAVSDETLDALHLDVLAALKPPDGAAG